MKRIVIHRAGGYRQLRIEQQATPQPAPGELLIAVSHIGVNYADCIVRMGLYASAKQYVGWPITPGFEVAGQVIARGQGAEQFAVGDDVIAVTLFGGYSSQLCVPEAQVFRRPEGLPPAQAAGIPAVFLTAWMALRELAHQRATERVLIHSAAGGVGSAAVQLASLAGAEVTAVVGAPHKRALPAELGAANVIDKSTEDLWQRADAIAPEGYDIILDANGASTLAHSYARLAPLGRLMVYGFHSMMTRSHDGSAGRPDWPRLIATWLRTPRFNPLRMTQENRSVMGFNLSFLSTRPDLLIPAMHQILEWLSSGQLRPLPVQEFALDDVAEAHRTLESAQTTGKLILTV